MSRLKLAVWVMALAVLSWGVNVIYAPPSQAANESPAAIESSGGQQDSAAALHAIEKRKEAIERRRAAQDAVKSALNAAKVPESTPASGNGGKEVSK